MPRRSKRRLLPFASAALVIAASCTGLTPAPVPTLTDVRVGYGMAFVNPDANIVLTFASPVDATWRADENVRFTPPVDCQFSWHPAAHKVTCDPQSPLEVDTTYEWHIREVQVPLTTEGVLRGPSPRDTFQTGDGPVATTVPEDGDWTYDEPPQLEILFQQSMNTETVNAAFDDGALTAIDGLTPAACSNITWDLNDKRVRCTPDELIFSYRLELNASVETASGDQPFTSPFVLEWSVSFGPYDP